MTTSTNPMIVNPVPSKTWYWLRMNDRKVAVPTAILPYLPDTSVNGAALSTDVAALATVCGGAGSDVRTLIDSTVTETNVYTAEDQARIKCVYRFDSANTASSTGLIIPAGKEMLCIMDFTSADDAEGMALVQTLFSIEEKAHLTLVQIHRIGDRFHLINDIGGNIAENARIDLINVVLSGKENDEACRFSLVGKHAHAEIHTGYQVTNDHVLDINYIVPHIGKKTTCNIEANGVLRDEAKKTFRGTIDFRHGAAGAVGAEKENVLLIDDTVSNQTLPVILCSEEDVEGTHGASIGKLDDSLLFYLQSRGLSTEEIYEMMAVARISAVVSLIPDQETRDELDAYLERNSEE